MAKYIPASEGTPHQIFVLIFRHGWLNGVSLHLPSLGDVYLFAQRVPASIREGGNTMLPVYHVDYTKMYYTCMHRNMYYLLAYKVLVNFSVFYVRVIKDK